MRKPKFIFKIDRNNRAKVYVNGKWQKYVTSVEIDAKPFDHDIEIEQQKRNADGTPMIKGNELACEIKKFHFGE